MSSITVPSNSAAVAHSRRNSSSEPNSGSTSMLMRSKWPSTDGVSRRPLSPPACLTGPVWTPSMPISRNACHSAGSASADRNVSPLRVTNDSG